MSDEKLERWSAIHDGEKISLVRGPEGYWTPWHLADAEITSLRAEVAELRTRLDRIRAVVEEQAKDDGLWFIARTAPEAYLQQELRNLHRVIEETP